MPRNQSIAPKERVNIVYKTTNGGSEEEKELPLKLLVLGDFTARPDPTPVENRRTININKNNFDEVMAEHKLALSIRVPNRLSANVDDELAVFLTFRDREDFLPSAVAQKVAAINALLQIRAALAFLKGPLGNRRAFRRRIEQIVKDPELRQRLLRELRRQPLEDEPGAKRTPVPDRERYVTDRTWSIVQSGSPELSLIEEVTREMGLVPADDAYPVARRGLECLFEELIASDGDDIRVDQSLVNELIVQIDSKVSSQLDVIYHSPDFQLLESAWRSLELLVDRTDFGQNIKIEMLNVYKEDLASDFADSPEVTRSGLYRVVYSAEYGQFGGEPFAALIGNYEFSPHANDVDLLHAVASVATMAHAPFIAAAAPSFFGEDTFLRLPYLKDVRAQMLGPRYNKWRAFRDSVDARSVGLTLPRFLLRSPYSSDGRDDLEFLYTENVLGDHRAYLWGNTAFAFATRLTESFANYRWCANIVGPSGGGMVEGLPVHVVESLGGFESKSPTEVLISERLEFELSEEGFIALAMRKNSDCACFFSAPSCQRPKSFGFGKEAQESETNFRLGTQLPYAFITNRIAHYIKILQRDRIGAVKDRADLEAELQSWVKQYVADYEAQPSVRARRPLRGARIVVSDVEGYPGWYSVELQVIPHFKYMGQFVTLSLVGRLDAEFHG